MTGENTSQNGNNEEILFHKVTVNCNKLTGKFLAILTSVCSTKTSSCHSHLSI